MTAPSRDECLGRAREALAFADGHLKAAQVLAKAELYPQAFGMLLYSVEESTKASIYLYAHLDLVTFDAGRAGECRYFCEDWLFIHPRKYVEFTRAQLGDLFPAVLVILLLAAAPDDEARAKVLAVLGVVALTIMGWGEKFATMRELAFHSGPPKIGLAAVSRPGRLDYETLEPMVAGELEELGETFDRPFDTDEIGKRLPSREGWQKFISLDPRVGKVWSAVSELWATPNLFGSDK